VKSEESDKDLKNNLLCYIENVIGAGTKELELVWYGGEPLLELQRINDLNKAIISRCSEADVKYSNILVTNGYGLDEETVPMLENQNIKYVQVTFDGTEHVHNKRRTTVTCENTFLKQFEGILLLLDKDLEVVIRINVDKENVQDLSNLLKYISENVENKHIGRNLFVDFGRVFGSENSLSFEKYESAYSSLFLEAVELGLICPSVAITDLKAFCSAETDGMNLVLDHAGNIYKCWNELYHTEATVGHISDAISSNLSKDNAVFQQYFYTLSLENVNKGKCLNCVYIKLCGGFCPYTRKMILTDREENIYENDLCKQLVRTRLETYITSYLRMYANKSAFG